MQVCLFVNSTDTYLSRYYFDKPQLAEACSVDVEDIDRLLGYRLVPAPSYEVPGHGLLVSCVFGELPAGDARPGQYFHRKATVWVKQAIEAERSEGADEARGLLRDRFCRDFECALEALNGTLFRLPDAFTESGEAIAGGVQRRVESAWTCLLQGVFSVCVADPSTAARIAEKEVLQEAIVALSDDGGRRAFSGPEARVLGGLMDRYAVACMPFAPQEYPLSSRKRLIEDLGARLA